VIVILAFILGNSGLLLRAPIETIIKFKVIILRDLLKKTLYESKIALLIIWRLFYIF